MSEIKTELPRHTAEKLASPGQMIFASLVVIGLATVALLWGPMTVAKIGVMGAIAFFAAFVGIKMVLHVAALNYRFPRLVLPDENDPDLPSYTVFVPVYKEGEILPQLIEALDGLRYPKDRLQVLILIEEVDLETRMAVDELIHAGQLPLNFKVIDVPDGRPRTKPRACNVGMTEATGEFCVIFDAEDRPEPDQLLKAVAGFNYYIEKDPRVICLQARLAFWNRTSWVTRLYAAEYYVHFNWMLPGLAKLGIVPPLGGTSNHFRTEVLREIAIDPARLPEGVESIGVWDPFNVTEDAELGQAIAKRGLRVEILDSTTWEEATARPWKSIGQRSRWMKGYIQTGLAGTRYPVRSIRRMGFKNWFVGIMLMLGTPLSQILNPIFWGMTVWYIWSQPAFIESLFQGVTFYAGFLLMIFGNFLLFYQLMFANAGLRKEMEGGAIYSFLLPIWWLMTSFATLRAVSELIRPSKRHYWNKSQHGHDMSKEGEQLGAIRSNLDLDSI